MYLLKLGFDICEKNVYVIHKFLTSNPTVADPRRAIKKANKKKLQQSKILHNARNRTDKH